MDIPYLSEEVIARHLHYPALIGVMEKAMIELSEGDVIQPVRQMLPIEPDQRYLGIMPAASSDGMGAKLVAFYPKNAGTAHHTHLGVIALFDPETGQPLAFLDGRLITEMRTAANSAAVTRHAATPGAKRLGLIGAGIQGAAHLAALSVDHSFDEVAIWSRTPAHAHAFADRHGARVAATPQEAVQDADIVVVATNAREPVVNGAWLKPGCHVNSVGSPRHDWRELDDAVMANTLIVDSREAVRKESGDVILSGADIFADAGEVISGRKPVDRKETTVFKSVGVAVQDIATARHVFDVYRSTDG
ncbi:MAG: NAD(P)-binding domain-containing protein [Pseudomonadota bacterium]